MVSDPINVEEFNADELDKFLDSFDYVFSDCDGVIWGTTGPLTKSGRFFELMRKFGKTVQYVSNNSLRTKENYMEKFKSVEIEDGIENLTIPSVAIVDYLKTQNFTKKIYAVTCKETINVLKANGFECKEGPLEAPDSYLAFIQFLKDDDEIGAVVFDSDFRINLPKLYRAVTYLKRPEVLFINGATDKYVPLLPGLTALGTGQFSDMVEEYTKRKPVVLGKPAKAFGEYAMKRAGATDPSRVLFIGDMIEQDVGLGKETGFKTLLVLTTVNKEQMLENQDIRPDYYAANLGSIVPLLEKKLSNKL